jgi:hypothetical protein
MDKAQRPSAATQQRAARKLDWRRKMSDNVAYALLVYTGLQIFVTMTVLKTGHGSALPYLALVVLIAAIIPACRLFEKRWERLAETDAPREELSPLFARDVAVLWIAAIGLPFVVTGLIKVLLALL